MDVIEEWAEEVSIGLGALGILASLLTWAKVSGVADAGYSTGLGVVALISSIIVFGLAIALHFEQIDSRDGWRLATLFAALMLAVSVIDGFRIWDNGPGDLTARPGLGLWLTVIVSSVLVGLAITLTWEIYFDDDDEDE